VAAEAAEAEAVGVGAAVGAGGDRLERRLKENQGAR